MKDLMVIRYAIKFVHTTLYNQTYLSIFLYGTIVCISFIEVDICQCSFLNVVGM